MEESRMKSVPILEVIRVDSWQESLEKPWKKYQKFSNESREQFMKESWGNSLKKIKRSVRDNPEGISERIVEET